MIIEACCWTPIFAAGFAFESVSANTSSIVWLPLILTPTLYAHICRTHMTMYAGSGIMMYLSMVVTMWFCC